MKNRMLICLAACSALLYPGCAKLDEAPLDFVGPDNYYNNPAQIESAFAGSMSRLFTWWSDYGFYARYYAFVGTDQIRNGDLVLSPSHGSVLWQVHYDAIADLNPAIKSLNEDKLGSGVSQTDKDVLMAQGRLLRAFNYFFLVRMFGDVPLITETTDVINDEIVRTPISEVYDYIIADLKFAITNLPNSWGSETPGKPTSGVAKGMLAKVYLTMATAPMNDTSYYQLARDMALDVMDDGIYQLENDVNNVFSLANKYGPEMMFSFNTTLDDAATPPQIWLPSHLGGWGDIRANPIWFEAYPDQDRKKAYLLLDDWDGIGYKDWPNGVEYVVHKFLSNTLEELTRRVNTQNVPILRYADVVLIFAEAENMANGAPTQAAVDAVNLIIDRANGHTDNPNYPKLTTAMSVSEFDSAVINERNLELCFEHDRWFDLVRKRILCDVVNEDIKPNCDDNDYLFPIPQTDLRLNPLLTQNPGYPSPGGSQ